MISSPDTLQTCLAVSRAQSAPPCDSLLTRLAPRFLDRSPVSSPAFIYINSLLLISPFNCPHRHLCPVYIPCHAFPPTSPRYMLTMHPLPSSKGISLPSIHEMFPGASFSYSIRIASHVSHFCQNISAMRLQISPTPLNSARCHP